MARAQDGTQYAPIGTFAHWKKIGFDWIISNTADPDKAMEQINKPNWKHSFRVRRGPTQKLAHGGRIVRRCCTLRLIL